MKLTLTQEEITFAIEAYLAFKGYTGTELTLNYFGDKYQMTISNISPMSLNSGQKQELIKLIENKKF